MTDTKALEGLRAKVAAALKSYRHMQNAMQNGCHDGYCVIEKTRGMHTNGGCDCLQDLSFQQRQYVGHMLRSSQTMADFIDATLAQATGGDE